MVLKRLWIDEADAAQKIAASEAPDFVKQAALDIAEHGFAILRGVHDPALCSAVTDDYHRWVAANESYAGTQRDDLGRQKRLVNFHHASENALKIGMNPALLAVQDFLFGHKTAIYTSLTFQFGTLQPVHRDVPHFATWPDNYFFGVWTALEDIDPDAGPLFYHPGAHRWQVDHHAILDRLVAQHPEKTPQELYELALQGYYGVVIEEAPNYGQPVLAQMNKGDVAIWHAQTPHGGSMARNPLLSRWSIVFHNTPEQVQVHHHDRYFGHRSAAPPPGRYGFRDHQGRKIALAGETQFM